MRNPAISLAAFLLFTSTCFCTPACGQKEFGFKMPENVKSITIPFEQHNNLILIPVTINGFLTLKFILDTGVETAILTEKVYGDILRMNYSREITIAGPGLVDSVQAYVATGVTFNLPQGVIGRNMNMLVLKEDYLELSKNIGDNVHGIIGYDIFSRFVVDIDYDENLLTLIDPDRFKPKKRYEVIPLDIRGSKPFIEAKVQQDGTRTYLDIMVDSGASHAALIDYSTVDSIDIPKKTITTALGRGIAGEIPGYLGRMDTVELGKYDFQKMLVSAPFEGAYNKVIKRGSRVGTFGGELLNRFHVIFDYRNEKMYLLRGRQFKDPFEHDMSGMYLNAIGPNLDTLQVIRVESGSPAYKADIQKGDVLLFVNGKSLKSNTLSQIYSLLSSKDGRKIRCKILREGEIFKVQFRLKRAI